MSSSIVLHLVSRTCRAVKSSIWARYTEPPNYKAAHSFGIISIALVSR